MCVCVGVCGCVCVCVCTCMYIYVRVNSIGWDVQCVGTHLYGPTYASTWAYMAVGTLMNEARLSHLPFWGPSEGLFLINSTTVG